MAGVEGGRHEAAAAQASRFGVACGAGFSSPGTASRRSRAFTCRRLQGKREVSRLHVMDISTEHVATMPNSVPIWHRCRGRGARCRSWRRAFMCSAAPRPLWAQVALRTPHALPRVRVPVRRQVARAPPDAEREGGSAAGSALERGPERAPLLGGAALAGADGLPAPEGLPHRPRERDAATHGRRARPVVRGLRRPPRGQRADRRREPRRRRPRREQRH
mmetsp:Transcript_34722/g.99150  ORF Transcript_34722/g.99150 Transcript_34722/m.99150 type:complete len:219 (+) Transcript_34722:3-659(+)